MGKKPGRPRQYEERVQSAFRCPPDLLADARGSAAAHDVGFNLWLERAMRHYLAHLGAPSAEEASRSPWSWDDQPDE